MSEFATVINNETETSLTANQAARWFLGRNRMAVAEMDGELISNSKLQKLLYYAQGAHLAITGKPLFNEPIYAWRYGPVVESVYQEYKRFGDNGIEFDGCDIEEFGFIDSQTEDILNQVYDVFGQYSAWKLYEMTREEAPWKAAEQAEALSHAVIQNYFKENYVGE